MILIAGGRGNMGRRYRAILDYLERPYQIIEQEHSPAYVRRVAQEADGMIIATPTSTHVEMIRKFIPYGKPILCEKPLCRDLTELKELFREINESDAFLSMVMQYRVLAPKRYSRSSPPTSLYDYYRHGSDGLIWDCIQIIGLAAGAVILSEESPIWKCTINGKKLDLGQMDMAYVKFIEGWLKDPGDDLGEVLAMHEKTWEAEQLLPTGRGH